MKTIKKAIDINAPKEKVWEVLMKDELNRIWYAEFMEGTYAETDWKVGSKAVFKDQTNSGMINRVLVNKPNELLSMEVLGFVADGVEDYESEAVKSVQGGKETYQLTDNEGVTHLAIESGMSEEMFESMSASWEKALQKIKELAESKLKIKNYYGWWKNDSEISLKKKL